VIVRMWIPTLVLAGWTGGCGWGDATLPEPRAAPPATAAQEDGSCGGCHAEQVAAWTGSHHDLAMQAATPQTVLGDFEEGALRVGDTTWRMHRDAEGFRFTVTEPGRPPVTLTVAHTLGVEPLQQYLVSQPGGRLQALHVAWDARPASEGGQRWFHLLAEDPPRPGEPAHWTGWAMNAQTSCLACHVTGFVKGFDPPQGTYRSSWTAEDVSCAACHGDGEAHAAWARAGSHGEDPLPNPMGEDGGRWVFEADAAIARRQGERLPSTELDTCAPCHSRRSRLVESLTPGASVHDQARVSLLDEGLYFDDGQIRDEVYVYGSFVQSRMHAAGVVCSDCHEPHGLGLRAEGNAVCATCHRPAVFDVPAHHHHGEGASCVDCHMPARTYMGVDPRRDHSLRVPRPHLSADIGTPHACHGCHQDRDVAWAVAAVERWWGAPDAEDEARMAPARVLHAWRQGDRTVAGTLADWVVEPQVPGIMRATLAAAWMRQPTRPWLPMASLRTDPDPFVRRAVAEGLSLAGAADDPRLAVRVASANGDEALRALMVMADHPASQLSIGAIHQARGAVAEAETWMSRVLATQPEDPRALHAMGLLRVRQGRRDEAVEVLVQAASLAPETPRFAYVAAVALLEAGRRDAARALVAEARRRHPEDADLRTVEAALDP